MDVGTELSLAEMVRVLASDARKSVKRTFSIRKVDWAEGEMTVKGSLDSVDFELVADFNDAPSSLDVDCSVCGFGFVCDHLKAALVYVDEQGIAAGIDSKDYEPCEFTGAAAKKTKSNPWKRQLSDLVDGFKHHSPLESQAVLKFPAGREMIYVIQKSVYGDEAQKLYIVLATRPTNVPQSAVAAAAKIQRAGSSPGPGYRSFNAGLDVWLASPDPLDREIAESVSRITHDDDYRYGAQRNKFCLRVETSAELIGRLARSGRLFFNGDYSLNDRIQPVGWICDEMFELRFEVDGRDAKNLRLGLCAVSPAIKIPHAELARVYSRYFFDVRGALGLFCRPVDANLNDTLQSGQPISVPRKHADELIEQVLGLPIGVPVDFIGCDDVKPARIEAAPKPRIHIKAPPATGENLDSAVHFDYDGVLVPTGTRHVEFYDKARKAVVQIDRDFHTKCHDELLTHGLKLRQDYNGISYRFPKKKLPAIVARLIQSGWHVEAEGKLYRQGSSFEMNLVSGIDWFELHGKAHFEQTSIDLPRLLQSLKAGERSMVLDDGSIGLIPDDWLKRFSGLTSLANTDGETIKFGASQVGLLDALLAEQPNVNIDEKFTAALRSLRAFDRIVPQEPPAGFVGELRPYQKLALGWFEFLRGLGFGGCLADDMGLGKTIQVLAMLEQRRQSGSGPSLIVVPRSLIFNWTAEAKKFAPQMRVLDQSHSHRLRGTEHLALVDLVLTTYGTLRRDAAFLKDFEFDYVVLDEAQAIKNADTEASKAARLLRGRHKLALSGTPIENHLRELWSLFDFLNPGMLGRVGRFSALANGADLDQRKMLATAVRPYILRRTKKQVAPELPDRIEQTVIVELDEKHRRSYDELRDFYRQKLLTKIESDGIGKSQIIILEALLRLRQAACHPGLIDKARINEPAAKLDELLDRLTTASAEGERVLVFSQFTSLLAIVKTRLKKAGIAFLYLDGKTRDRQALVEQFQSGTGPGVFLISLKAGGVGLNLTAARAVYLLDPWWNPAVEAQAIDRAHRIGQQQTVFATRLIAADTVEQKVLELQSRKRGLADAIINADNAGISSLTREDLELLLA